MGYDSRGSEGASSQRRWVADDGFDGDGDPARDANGRLQLFAEAHGIARTRQAVQGVIARGADGTIRVLTMGSTR